MMDFPDSLEGFGYEFNEDGKLQEIETGKPFQFEVEKDNHPYNQARYEAIGQLITPYIYQLLEKRCGLKRYPVPVDASEEDHQTFIFCSEDFRDADRLMVLIHGSGVVRAGQWARRLIINDSLNSGTQIPFIERGIKEGYGILVMNTNHNTEIVQGKRKTIKGSENPEAHGKYVWKNYIRKCKASKVAIIAHSFGGVVTVRLFEAFKREFVDRVFAVALTDSVHFQSSDLTELIKVGKNWVTSHQPLDTSIPRRGRDVPCVSAGCSQHEMTSWSSFESIFKFLYSKLLPVEDLAKSSCKLPLPASSKLSIPVDHSVSSSDEEDKSKETKNGLEKSESNQTEDKLEEDPDEYKDCQEFASKQMDVQDPETPPDSEIYQMKDETDENREVSSELQGNVKPNSDAQNSPEKSGNEPEVDVERSDDMEQCFKKLKCDKSFG